MRIRRCANRGSRNVILWEVSYIIGKTSIDYRTPEHIGVSRVRKRCKSTFGSAKHGISVKI